jgi:hypothetical protein
MDRHGGNLSQSDRYKKPSLSVFLIVRFEQRCRLRVAAYARRLCSGRGKHREREQPSYRGKVRTGGPIPFTPSLKLDHAKMALGHPAGQGQRRQTQHNNHSICARVGRYAAHSNSRLLGRRDFVRCPLNVLERVVQRRCAPASENAPQSGGVAAGP